MCCTGQFRLSADNFPANRTTFPQSYNNPFILDSDWVSV